MRQGLYPSSPSTCIAGREDFAPAAPAGIAALRAKPFPLRRIVDPGQRLIGIELGINAGRDNFFQISPRLQRLAVFRPGVVPAISHQQVVTGDGRVVGIHHQSMPQGVAPVSQREYKIHGAAVAQVETPQLVFDLEFKLGELLWLIHEPCPRWLAQGALQT